MACLSNGNSSSSPATTSSMTKFSNVSCDKVVLRWLTRHDLPSRRTWVQKKSLQSSTTGALSEEAVWQGPTDALARSRSPSSEEIFSGPKYDEKATPIGSANTRSHFGPCNSLRCEMAPCAASIMRPLSRGRPRDNSAVHGASEDVPGMTYDVPDVSYPIPWTSGDCPQGRRPPSGRPRDTQFGIDWSLLPSGCPQGVRTAEVQPITARTHYGQEVGLPTVRPKPEVDVP